MTMQMCFKIKIKGSSIKLFILEVPEVINQKLNFIKCLVFVLLI